MARSGLWPATMRSSPGAVLGLGHDVDALLAQQRDEALAQEGLVLDDHDPHGSSACTRRPRRVAGDRQGAVERLDAMAQPREPGAVRVGAARPVVADLDTSWPSCSASSTGRRRRGRAWPRWSASRRPRSRRRSRRPAAGGGADRALTVTGIGARRPSASTAATRPRSARTGGAMPRARSRSSPIAAPASSRASRTNSATSGWPSRRSSARPSCMLRATRRAWAPSCRSRSIRRSSAAWTSRAPRARAREHVDAGGELALLRAQAGQRHDDDRVRAEREGERGHRPQRPERPAAGERVDRQEHGHDPARRRAVQGERPHARPRAPAGRRARRAGSPAAPRRRRSPTSARSRRRRSRPR